MHEASWTIEFDTAQLVPGWRELVEAAFRQRHLPLTNFEVDKHPRGGLRVRPFHTCSGPCPWTREVLEQAGFDAAEALRKAWAMRGQVASSDEDRFVVFYSWQSASPKTNRNCIEDALKRSVQALKKDDSILVEPVIDRDTSGVAGSPDIAATIFGKIERASVFVADVSLVLCDPSHEPPRLSPNPNVLLELGYAAHALGWDRILLVANTHFGAVERLPFDLRPRRVASYQMSPEDKPADARNVLAGKLEDALRHAIALGSRHQGDLRLVDKLLSLKREVSKANNSSFAPVQLATTIQFPGVSREEYKGRIAQILAQSPAGSARDLPDPSKLQTGACKGEIVELEEADEEQILLVIPPRGLRVFVPLSQVNDVWRHSHRLLGIALDMTIVVPEDVYTEPIRLVRP